MARSANISCILSLRLDFVDDLSEQKAFDQYIKSAAFAIVIE